MSQVAPVVDGAKNGVAQPAAHLWPFRLYVLHLLLAAWWCAGADICPEGTWQIRQKWRAKARRYSTITVFRTVHRKPTMTRTVLVSGVLVAGLASFCLGGIARIASAARLLANMLICAARCHPPVACIASFSATHPCCPLARASSFSGCGCWACTCRSMEYYQWDCFRYWCSMLGAIMTCGFLLLVFRWSPIWALQCTHRKTHRKVSPYPSFVSCCPSPVD